MLPYVGLEASNLCMTSANSVSRGMNIRAIPCSNIPSICRVCVFPPPVQWTITREFGWLGEVNNNTPRAVLGTLLGCPPKPMPRQWQYNFEPHIIDTRQCMCLFFVGSAPLIAKIFEWDGGWVEEHCAKCNIKWIGFDTLSGGSVGQGQHGFMLCGTESTKNISTRYKSYGIVDLYQFLHRKCVLPVQFLNLPFHQITTYISIFCSQTQNPQHTTQNNQNGPLPPYPPAALPSLSMGRAAMPPNLGAPSPNGSFAGAWHWVHARNGRFLCLRWIFNQHQ